MGGSTVACELLIYNSELLVTMDGPDIAGGWVAISDGKILSVGTVGTEPDASETIDAKGCLVTPGFINTHHHMYQNLTRNCAAAELERGLVPWLEALYPAWSLMDEEAVYLSTYVALAELALGGCTTSCDHLNVHPMPGLMDAQMLAADQVGLRFHATRGSMDLSRKDGALPPDSAVEDIDTILADCERLVARYHDPAPLAMKQVAIAPCNPFATSNRLMIDSAALAERLDVRLHTHLAETPDEEQFCVEKFGARPTERLDDTGFVNDRTWVAHGIFVSDADIDRMGTAHTGVAHCPTSNVLFNRALTPVRDYRAHGAPVGLGCDGGASAGHCSLYNEARLMALVGDLLPGEPRMTARDALSVATVGGAACLGRQHDLGRISPGYAGDVVVWPVDGLFFSGVHGDPVTAWLRSGPTFARHTIVAGRQIVADGRLTLDEVENVWRRHHAIAGRLQETAGLIAQASP